MKPHNRNKITDPELDAHFYLNNTMIFKDCDKIFFCYTPIIFVVIFLLLVFPSSYNYQQESRLEKFNRIILQCKRYYFGRLNLRNFFFFQFVCLLPYIPLFFYTPFCSPLLIISSVIIFKFLKTFLIDRCSYLLISLAFDLTCQKPVRMEDSFAVFQ